jgi:hypothetical protein
MTLEKAAEILGLDSLRFIEPSFADQTATVFNTTLADYRMDEGRLLLDEKQDPLALAFHGIDGWIVGSFLFRSPTSTLIERFEKTCGEILQEERTVWAAAVREYFSRKLLMEAQPAIEDLNPARRGILTDLINGIWGKSSGKTCLDCCCGSGVGSLVLRDLGYSPISYDNDETLLVRGLTEGRLLPEETMWLDATIASRYIEPVPRGIAIMAGEINSFSQDMWKRIIEELFMNSAETLVTVGTKKEADHIQEWGAAMDRKVEIQENPADPIYDLWVCVASQHLS